MPYVSGAPLVTGSGLSSRKTTISGRPPLSVGVAVNVAVGVHVAVGVGVGEGVGVAVGVAVGVLVAVGVDVAVAVAVGVTVGVAVFVGVLVAVAVGVGMSTDVNAVDELFCSFVSTMLFFASTTAVLLTTVGAVAETKPVARMVAIAAGPVPMDPRSQSSCPPVSEPTITHDPRSVENDVYVKSAGGVAIRLTNGAPADPRLRTSNV
jgi:hypothetical protein